MSIVPKKEFFIDRDPSSVQLGEETEECLGGGSLEVFEEGFGNWDDTFLMVEFPWSFELLQVRGRRAYTSCERRVSLMQL